MSKVQQWALAAGIALFFVLLWLLGPILTPFIVAALLAYLCDPMVERLCRWKLPRTLSVILVLLFVLSLIALFFLLVIPLMRHEFLLVKERLPMISAWFEQTAVPWVVHTFNLDPKQFSVVQLKATFSDHVPEFGNLVGALVGKVGKSGLALVGLVVNLFLIPVVLFFLLRDWPRVKTGVVNLSPVEWRKRFGPLMLECDGALSAFLRGQFMVMLSLAVFYTVGLWIVGLDIFLLVGVFAGLASFIPYLGFSLGLILAVIGALLQFSDPTMALWVIGVFIAGQALEGVVLQPLLLGDRIGLHPVAVIFAIMAGGQLFGFTGVLVALPVAAVLMVLIKRAVKSYQETRWYSEESDETIAPVAINERETTASTQGDIT